jgi:orotidine-5'-phosphate decarboxylase
MREGFGVRLGERVRAMGPLCVGIDLSRNLLLSWDRSDSVEGLEFASLAVLDAVLDTAVAIKPQVAYFERFGAEGFRVLERLLSDARDADVLTVADAKRGDVVSTNDGYAEAWLSERSPLRVDAVTTSPFLGIESLSPFFALANETGRGVFVLAATSNDEGRPIQTARTLENQQVQDFVLTQIAEMNDRPDGRGSVGAVLGATRENPEFNVASLGGPFLVPGVGSQGANADHVARLFGRCPQGTVLVNVSRAILEAGPERSALRDTARRWRDDLSQALP